MFVFLRKKGNVALPFPRNSSHHGDILRGSQKKRAAFDECSIEFPFSIWCVSVVPFFFPSVNGQVTHLCRTRPWQPQLFIDRPGPVQQASRGGLWQSQRQKSKPTRRGLCISVCYVGLLKNSRLHGNEIYFLHFAAGNNNIFLFLALILFSFFGEIGSKTCSIFDDGVGPSGASSSYQKR